MNIIVTGGCGFIGSTLIKFLLNSDKNHSIANIDKLAYAGSTANLASVQSHPNLSFYQQDICDKLQMRKIFYDFQPSVVFNLAAESHVDRSIDAPSQSVMTNILGTQNLLETTRAYLHKQPNEQRYGFKFIQVSSNEVFGALGLHEAPWSEDSPYLPSSPYAASKASANHLVKAWYRTYGIPCIITHASNNYGPFQFPEKMIPLMILKALKGENLPVYEDGQQTRDWLHVNDHVKALTMVMEEGVSGESYNIGGNQELSNLEVVSGICKILDKKQNNSALDGQGLNRLITLVKDRPGHDIRHALSSSKISDQLNWKAIIEFEQGLEATIDWYLNHEAWCETVLSALNGQN